MSDLKNVTLYTDGGCSMNPGPGGYGTILNYKGHVKELSGGFRLTTNNRMEIMAVIVGLEDLNQRCTVVVYSDSQYVVNAIMKGWAKRWKVNKWKRNKNDKAINVDLWIRLLDLCEHHNVDFKWVKGHAGNELNEQCDILAKNAFSMDDLPIDEGYEKKDE